MNKELQHSVTKASIDLLKKLISTPSFSKEEGDTATIIEQFLQANNVIVNRYLNNVWAKNKYFDESKPNLLLNSHHDTVKPNKAYTLDPFSPIEKEGKIFGLGSNDAGGSLVALMAVFLYFYEAADLQFNLVFAATAEEEISGKNGIEILLDHTNADGYRRKGFIGIGYNNHRQSGSCRPGRR